MSTLLERYDAFLRAKLQLATPRGFEIPLDAINPLCQPHQRDIIRWKIAGGTRANFSAFGTGKTPEQIEPARIIQHHTNGHFLQVVRLTNRRGFMADGHMEGESWKKRAAELGLDYDRVRREYSIDYRWVQSTDQVGEPGIYLTNYESVRERKLDVSKFDAVALDEASILRGFGATKTFRELMAMFEGSAKYRFVDTATPSPNDYIELLAYAAFLDIMDVGQAKTRWFKRDSEKADHLTLRPGKEREFWLWVSSWAVFLQRPSDLGYSDEGYELPEMEVHWHELPSSYEDAGIESSGQGRLVPDSRLGVVTASREKRRSMHARIAKMMELRAIDPGAHRVIWHDLEDERVAIEKALRDSDAKCWETVTGNGSQSLEERETVLEAFENGKLQELSTKPVIAGRGCNFQYHCWWEIFCGIGFKFEDFIQAVYRVDRFLQPHKVRIDLIYTEAERGVRQLLEEKWENHKRLTAEMSALIRQYGLATNALEVEFGRTLGVERKEWRSEAAVLVHNDAVLEADQMAPDSVDLILTSIPFSTQYEYSPSYNDFGHTDSNEHFWQQMDFLTPNLLRVLKPGRIAAIHVKDRVVPSGLTGRGYQTVYPFSDDCRAHFERHGFGFLGRRTIVTDVVRENNQTYRLGWTEQCKDGSRMGPGMSEYLLLFRKDPSDTSNGYADAPVAKSKDNYTRSRWQIDAHAFWRSSGDRMLSAEDLVGITYPQMFQRFRTYSLGEIYDYERHVMLCESLEVCQRCGHIHTGDKRCLRCECKVDHSRLPKKFMLLQPQSWSGEVWSDVARMRTQNGALSADGNEMHLCPLQFDIVDRVVRMHSQPGEVVYDPFSGVGTVPLRAVKLGRKGYGSELAEGYWKSSVEYMQKEAQKLATPTLFGLLDQEGAA